MCDVNKHMPVNILRPITLLFLAITEMTLVYYFKGWISCRLSEFDLIGFDIKTFATLLLGAPVAFLLWYWRNKDKQTDIKHARETIENARFSREQSDFHKVQEWASSKENENKELKLTGIRRLIQYVIDDSRFKEPAWISIRDLLDLWDEKRIQLAAKKGVGIHKNLERATEVSTPKIIMPVTILRIHELIRKHDNIISKMNLVKINLNQAKLVGVNFKGADLLGAMLIKANLSDAIFKDAILIRSNLKDAILTSTDLTGARLDSAIWIDGRQCKEGTRGWPTEKDFEPEPEK